MHLPQILTKSSFIHHTVYIHDTCYVLTSERVWGRRWRMNISIFVVCLETLRWSVRDSMPGSALLDASAAQPMWKLGIVRLRPHRSSAMASLAVAGPDIHGTHVRTQADTYSQTWHTRYHVTLHMGSYSIWDRMQTSSSAELGLVVGATEAAPALRTGRFCTGRSSGFWAFVGPKRPKADAFWASCKFSFTFTRWHACMGPHPSVHRHSHAGSRRRPTLRGHGSSPLALPATLGLAASLEKTNACRWRANDPHSRTHSTL